MPGFRSLRAALFIVVVMPSFSGGQAADSRARDLDAFMKQQMAARHIPGAAVAVVSHGKAVLVRSYGLADVENGIPVSEHTVFELASVTKQFTATAIMMLVQDGKLALDDSIGTVLDSVPAAWRPVTVRQLLNHTSGIPEYARPQFRFDVRKEYSRQELLKPVASAPLDFAPGTKHSYSNTGYYLLGLIIEKQSGRTYDQFLRQHIFDPLGMKDTRLNDRSIVVPRRARGYSYVDYVVTNGDYTSPSTTFSAGGLVSSAADMALWLAAQGSTKLLSRERWEEMWSKPRLIDGSYSDYGFGWYVRASNGHRRLEHSGGLQGFATYTANFVDDSVSIMFLANSDVPMGRLGAGIFQIVLPATTSAPPKTIADADTAMTRLLQRVATELARGRGDSAWYTPKVQQYYFPDRIKSRKALSAIGPIKTFDLIEAADDGVRQRRVYRAMMGTTWVRFTFWVTAQRLVDGVNFEIE